MWRSITSSPNGSRFVGRTRELEQMRHLLETARAGQPALVLLGGEAGIGKTSLVETLAGEARYNHAIVLNGGCYDLTTTPPYGPWTEALHSAGSSASSLSGAPEPDLTDNQIELYERVWNDIFERASEDPVVLILEDLHWADGASLDLLRFMGRRMTTVQTDLPLLIVATYRDNELTHQRPLFHLLPALVREARAERISLHPFDVEETGAFIRAWFALPAADEARLVEYLLARGDGNPFFMSELLRTLEDEQQLQRVDDGWHVVDLAQVQVPPLIRQVIESRVARLSPATRAALEIAAIIGQDIGVELWGVVGDFSAAQLADIVDEAVQALLLKEIPDRTGFRFTHVLIQDAVYEGIALPRRRAWHRQVAEALAASANMIPGTVATHFQHAGDERAIEWHVLAGFQTSRFAWISAAHHFEAAATLLESDHTRYRERTWLCFKASNLLSFTGDPHSLELLDVAAHIAQEIGDTILAAYARHHRGLQRCMQGDVRRGLEDLRQGVAAIAALLETPDQLGPEQEEVAVVQRLLPSGAALRRYRTASQQLTSDAFNVNMKQGSLISWLGHTGRYHEAVALGESYLDSMTTEQFWSVSGLLGLGHAYAGRGHPVDARRIYRRARTESSEQGDHAMFEHTLWHELIMVHIPYDTDQLHDRSELMTEAADAWERVRGLTMTTDGDGAPSELPLDLLEGRWEQARKMAIAHLTSPWSGHVHEAIVVLGTLDRQQGYPNQAWNRVMELLPAGPDTEPGDVWFAPTMTAIALAVELKLDAGDLVTAQRWIETHQRWLDWSGARLWLADTQLLRARYHDLAGELSSAHLHAETALNLATEPRQPLRLIIAYRQLGRLARLDRDYERAATLLNESLTLADACAAPFERALTLLEVAELHLASSYDPAHTLDEITRICTPLTARPTLQSVAELAARIDGAPKPIMAAALPDRLTRREVEVLRLIAAGDSNRQIAETLFLSARTVERHIANIYLKINAHNKADATAYAFHQGLALRNNRRDEIHQPADP